MKVRRNIKVKPKNNICIRISPRYFCKKPVKLSKIINPDFRIQFFIIRGGIYCRKWSISGNFRTLIPEV